MFFCLVRVNFFTHPLTVPVASLVSSFFRFGLLGIAFLGLMIVSGCAEDSSYGKESEGDQAETANGSQFDENGCELVQGSMSLRVNGVAVELKAPSTQPIGDLLLLPPWNESDDVWCTRSRMCSKAIKKGFRIIMPAMGKSIYCQNSYPETRQDWKSEPTWTFLQDTLIPILQDRFCLMTPGGNNFVIGVGSGARGAVRLCEEMPDLFKGAAALSGDYNPSLNPNDNLYRGFLGDYEVYDIRWKETENLCHEVSAIRTPLWLSHGEADQYVPATQTEFFYNVLRERNPNLKIRYTLVPDKADGFEFWNTQMNDILQFFETCSSAHPEAP